MEQFNSNIDKPLLVYDYLSILE